ETVNVPCRVPLESKLLPPILKPNARPFSTGKDAEPSKVPRPGEAAHQRLPATSSGGDLDRPAGRGRLVDRPDQRDGLAPLPAVDQRRAVIADGVDEVGQLAGVVDV